MQHTHSSTTEASPDEQGKGLIARIWGQMRIRTRISIVFLIAILPGFGMRLSTIQIDAAARESAISSRLLQIAAQEATRQQSEVAVAKAFATLLASRIRVDPDVGANCGGALTDTQLPDMELMSLNVANRAGVIECSDREEQIGSQVANYTHNLIEQSLSTRDAVISKVHSPIQTGRASRLIVYPIVPDVSQAGTNAAAADLVAIVLVDQSRMNAMSTLTREDDGEVVLALSPSGQLLARHPPAPVTDRTPMLNQALAIAAFNGERPVVRGLGLDGLERLYGVAPTADGGRILVGVLADKVDGPTRTAVIRAVVVALLTMLATIVFVVLIAERLISKPLAHLINAMRLYRISHPLQMPARLPTGEIGEVFEHVRRLTSRINQDSSKLFYSEARLRMTNAALEEATAKAEEERDQARAAARARADFLAVMSHEIRTPLNGLLGYAELLNGMTLSPEQREIVERQRSSGELLRAIVDEVLTLAKLESGKFDLDRQAHAIRKLAADALDTCRASANSKSLKLELEIGNDVPEACDIDRVRMLQILSNLLSNAVKFTERGHVRLMIHRDRRGAADALWFRVEDTGIGISPEDAVRLFDPYTQVRSRAQQRTEGTGLGLAICKRLVSAMGGSIGVSPRPGGGTVFHLTILAPEVALAPEGPHESDADVARCHRILVVDDNAINLDMLRRLLLREGMEVETVNSGAKALELAPTWQPEVILMDLQMPQMDGCEATRRLLAMAGPNPPFTVIGVTASVSETELEGCLKAGMAGVVAKPVDMRALMARLDAVARLRASTPPPEPPPPAAADQKPAVDQALLDNLTQGMPAADLRSLIEDGLKELTRLSDEVADETQLTDDRASAAHQGVAVAGWLGCDRLRACYADIESVLRYGAVMDPDPTTRLASELSQATHGLTSWLEAHLAGSSERPEASPPPGIEAVNA